ncbi:hypothetical protein [Parapoynx stagnalis nucleopolyhedrovirus]|uniref:Uncharacterized protein n=1 Tax=Parapoynx stagnalis nucleopolyhedrovirus TaxID=2993413 RepID=A0A9E7YFF6_9ABAC|nr:hypothetical protein [Parapoynx stagnalis nucleopolyhedrovirus]
MLKRERPSAPAVYTKCHSIQDATVKFLLKLDKYNIFYKLANKFLHTNLLYENNTVTSLCMMIDVLVQFERNMFGKSLLLNGLMNFLLINSDGNTIQHILLQNLLGLMLTKYY